ncbi:MAG: VanZ family protein [Bacteroidales bacterium]|nr:VanZ family protein [Bacteroidales bacterium]
MGKKYFGYIFWSYILLMLVLTVVPWSTHVKLGFWIFKFRLDYWLHLGAYFGLAFLFILWQLNEFLDKHFYELFRSFAFCIAFAFGTELIQLFIPVRSFSLKDFVAGSAGVTFAFAIFILNKGWLKNSKLRLINV